MFLQFEPKKIVKGMLKIGREYFTFIKPDLKCTNYGINIVYKKLVIYVLDKTTNLTFYAGISNLQQFY